MKKSIEEAITFANDQALHSFLFKHLNPLSEQLMVAARNSETYKQTISYLNTLNKEMNIEVFISLSGRNFNKTIMVLGEELRKDVQEFFKEITGNLIYLYEDRLIASPPIFKEIPIENMKVKDVPLLQEELSIFHKIDLKLPPVLPEADDHSGYQIYTIYGNETIEKAYNTIISKVSIKKEKEDIEQDQQISAIEREEEIANMPFDKKYELVHLDNNVPDLNGPFLLRWL